MRWVATPRVSSTTGAVLVGSCCGSSPSFTGAIVDEAKPKRIRADRTRPAGVAVASARKTVRLGAGRPLVIVGERINPTGKKALADSLRAGSMEVVRSLAAAQERAGARPARRERGRRRRRRPGGAAEGRARAGRDDRPAARHRHDGPGRSRGGAQGVPRSRARQLVQRRRADSIATVLPLAKRYGAAVVVLALDDDGIPATAEGRLAVVERVRAAARADRARATTISSWTASS